MKSEADLLQPSITTSSSYASPFLNQHVTGTKETRLLLLRRYVRTKCLHLTVDRQHTCF